MHEIISERIKQSISVKELMLNDDDTYSYIHEVSSKIISALKSGNKIIFAGNGGSFSDAMHLAGEMVGRFQKERQPLAAMALGCNGTIATAIGNDYSYEDVLWREIIGVGNEGDIFIAISTSGNSPNILKAVNKAKEKKIKIYGLSGKDGGILKSECNTLVVQSDVTARIQEAHILTGHIICEIVEEAF